MQKSADKQDSKFLSEASEAAANAKAVVRTAGIRRRPEQRDHRSPVSLQN